MINPLITVMAEGISTATWTDIFKQAAGQIWPMIGSFIIPLLTIVIGFMLVFAVFKAFVEYRQGGEVQIKPIVFLIAGLAVMLALGANNAALLKSLLGLTF